MNALLFAALLAMSGPAQAKAEILPDRLVWIFGFDLEKGDETARVCEILENAGKHGINGVVLSAGLDNLSRRSEEFFKGLERVRKTCTKAGIEVIPAGFSFGYGSPFLSVDRNLAEGLEVRDALFVAGRDGKASLVPDPAVEIANGRFEEFSGNRFSGLGFQDEPGKITFADTKVKHGGKASVRLTSFAEDKWGHGRVQQAVKVHPYRCYRVTIWAKSRGLAPSGGFNLLALAPVEGEHRLAQRTFEIPSDTDWKRFSFLFNSREFESVRLYAGMWGGKSGELWLDDWRIEEVGPVNVLRRPGTPVSVRGEDGRKFEEGKDFTRLADPELSPWNSDRPALSLTVLPNGEIKPGTRLRVSWYHPMVIYRGQISVCMAEPAIYEIAKEQARALVERLKPKRILLNMDEIRMGGTCEACKGRDMGELLGESVSRIAAIIKDLDPKIKLYIWSDMFDPNHNARGNYYFVEGDYTGSWKHIPKDLTMAVWGSRADEKSFAFFAKEGFEVMGACYYDADDLDDVKGWLEMARRHRNVRGLMYTTWERKYDLLPAFGDLLSKPFAR